MCRLLIWGNQVHHGSNVQHFEPVCKARNSTLNSKQTIRNVTEVETLGYKRGNKIIRPDPEKLKRLEFFTPPTTFRELGTLKSLLAHYSRWILRFSSRLFPLTQVIGFPISGEALRVFKWFQQEIKHLQLQAYCEELPFTLEARSDPVATYAILKQLGKPVDYFSATLHRSRLRYPKAEKEASSIIAAVKH